MSEPHSPQIRLGLFWSARFEGTFASCNAMTAIPVLAPVLANRHVRLPCRVLDIVTARCTWIDRQRERLVLFAGSVAARSIDVRRTARDHPAITALPQ
jgi:hypothetical protein